MSAPDGGSPSGIQSVNRAFRLLDILSANGGQMTLSEMSVASGLPVPTIHRIVRTLLESGHVRQSAARRYVLGPKLIGLGENAAKMFGVWARPALVELSEKTGETANMALLDSDRAVYVAQVPSRHSMRMFTEVGRRVHLHCTGVGKALLAQMPPDVARQLLVAGGMPAMTEATIVDIDEMLTELQKIRDVGYSIDDGEQELGVRCVSVTVPQAPTLTAISVSGPESRVTHDRINQVATLLRESAEALSFQFE